MNGLDKSKKLQKNKEFQYVYRNGTYLVTHYAVIYKMPIGDKKTRIGFVTGKKVGCAVKRNRARRLMKEFYRLHQHEIIDGYNLVLVARQAINDKSYGEVEKSLYGLFKRAKLLANKKMGK